MQEKLRSITRFSLACALVACIAATASAEVIYGLTTDTDVRSDGVALSSSASSLVPGGSGSPALDRCSVFVFRLPNLGTVSAPFEYADFNFNLSSTDNTPPVLDLYGIPRRGSSVVQVSDYYGETSVADPTNATRLQSSIISPTASPGIKSLSISGKAALRDFLNTQYANGAGAGQHVFLRLSTRSAPNGVNRHSLTSADGATASPTDTRPRIIYNEPPPLVPRPFIWVRDSEKADILDKVANQPWAASLQASLQSRMAAALASHQADRDAFIRELPVDWNSSPAKYRTTKDYTENQVRGPSEGKFNAALDCAVLYYLTGNTDYAELAADILHNTVKTLIEAESSTVVGNGGWIFHTDLLKEARITGTQLPVVYDFLYKYLQENQVYDVQTAGMSDFAFTQAQDVFSKYYELCRDHGQTGNNWSSLMATCMLNNLLALDDENQRESALQVYITSGGPRQDSLSDDYNVYSDPENIWPESLQYAGTVPEIRATHMVLIERYDPSRNLFGNYPNLPKTLPRVSSLVYPNGQLIRFGDGRRIGGTPPYFRYDLIYQYALTTGRTDLTSLYGPLINAGIQSGEYNRGSLPSYSSLGMHDDLLKLLWTSPTIAESPSYPELARTDHLPFAGITLQRNLSPNGKPDNGLMAFVGGGGHVHSHASGMSMELYGLGHVLGAKNGRSDYGSTIHEKYYRLFAANNTVIVNGASRGEGNWQNLEINTVQDVVTEPQLSSNAVSPDHSFSVSTFADDKGTLAEANQQRTLGLVRTSPTSGFYVDIFRSSSSVTNRTATTLDGPVTDQYHDYIYRNVGELDVEVISGGSPAVFSAQTNRFKNDIGDSYDQPGWRYFENTKVTRPANQPLRARFTATIGGKDRCMTMHMPAVATREIAKVESPPISDAPSPYTNSKSPTLVIRQIGGAWNKPFAAVYEPHFGTQGGTVQNVTHLERNGVVVGVKVESVIDGSPVVHFVIANPGDGQTYEDPSLGLSFSGRYGIAADYGGGKINLYLGQGSSLSYKGRSISTNNGSSSQAEIRFSADQSPQVTANTAVKFTEPPRPTISAIEDQFITPDTSPLTIPFTVSDPEAPASAITVTASSSNPSLFPNGSLVISGTGSQRQLTLTPSADTFETATITLLADNGAAFTSLSFDVDVKSGTFLSNTLPSLPSDAEITDAPAIDGASSAVGLLGTSGSNPWVDRCMVFVFQLPNFGPVTDPFIEANFSFDYRNNTNTPSSNDLYGLAPRETPAVVTSQYYGKTSTPDPTAGIVRLQENILNGATQFGIINSSPTANEALISYLNAAYDSGANAGKYVFLRLNTTTPKTGVKRANIAFSEGGSEGPPDTRPKLDFTAYLPELLPTVSTPEDLSANVGESIATIPLAVSDPVASPESIVLTASSSNQQLLPDGQILISGTGANRTLTLTPVPDLLGTTTITLTADNGENTSTSTFQLSVTGDARQRWRFQHFDTTADVGESAMAADSDGDSFDNEAEYLFGTDPTSADSRATLGLTLGAEENTIEFIALKAEGPGYEGLNRRYTVQVSQNLIDWPAMPEADQVLGANQAVVIYLTDTTGARFFRLKATLGP